MKTNMLDCPGPSLSIARICLRIDMKVLIDTLLQPRNETRKEQEHTVVLQTLPWLWIYWDGMGEIYNSLKFVSLWVYEGWKQVELCLIIIPIF